MNLHALFVHVCVESDGSQSEPYISITHESIGLCLVLRGDWSPDTVLLIAASPEKWPLWHTPVVFMRRLHTQTDNVCLRVCVCTYTSCHLSASYGACGVYCVCSDVTKGASLSHYCLMVSELMLQPHAFPSDPVHMFTEENHVSLHHARLRSPTGIFALPLHYVLYMLSVCSQRWVQCPNRWVSIVEKHHSSQHRKQIFPLVF